MIKYLYECKGYNAWQFITEFPDKVGRRTALMVKLRKFGTVDMITDSVTRNFRNFRRCNLGRIFIMKHIKYETKPISLTVSEIFIVKCNAMVDVTLIRLIRPLNKGQGHSFYQ